MKKNVLFLTALAAVSMMVTGCNINVETTDSGMNINVTETAAVTEVAVNENNVQNNSAEAESETEATVTEALAVNEKAADEQPAVNEANIKTENQEKNEAVKEESKAQKERTPYEFSDDICCEGVASWENADGTITLEFENGNFALTMPSVWKGHFIFDGVSLRAKIASEKDGKLISMSFTEETVEPIWAKVIRGYSGNKYWTTSPVTDLRYDMDNKAEAEEYEMLQKNMNFIYESRNDNTGKMETLVTLPDNAVKGIISETEREQVYGYTDSYINGSVSEEEGRNWPVEGGWHITVKRVYSTDSYNAMYDCYDSDDGDHYGWILSGAINPVMK